MVTPAMQQYYDLKKDYSDTILFFRMGDFYEMFEDDAHIAHKVLGIAITSRNKNSDTPIALAGIPFHAKQKYLPLLIAAGYKVAIAEQVSDPKLKWIVRREVVRVVTPSTLSLESEAYDAVAESNLLVSLAHDDWVYGMSSLDITDNSWKTTQFDTMTDLWDYICKISPREVVLSKDLFNDTALRELLSKKYSLNIYYFEATEKPEWYLQQHFWVSSLSGFGIADKPLAQSASAQLLEYLLVNQKWDFSFLSSISYESLSDFLEIDESTMASLDLVYNFSTRSSKLGTLLWVINKTKTPMWKRFLRQQIGYPLQDISKIQDRQKFIESIKSDPILLDKITASLKNISDIDAILNRLALWRALPRDLLNLKQSLISILDIFDVIGNHSDKKVAKLLNL